MNDKNNYDERSGHWHTGPDVADYVELNRTWAIKWMKTQEETKATILGLCNWLEAAVALLPHAPPNNPDTLSFVGNLRGAVALARTLVGDKEEE